MNLCDRPCAEKTKCPATSQMASGQLWKCLRMQTGKSLDTFQLPFSKEEGNFQPAMLVHLGTEKQLPLPTRRLHLGPPLLSTRESIVIFFQGCFKFTSGIYNPFLSNQSEQNHTKYIHSLWNALPNKKPTPLWPRKVLFFVFRCFTAPPKIVDEIREVFRRFLHVETEPKFHWLAFEMMHAELPEGRLMVVKRSSPRNPLGS